MANSNKNQIVDGIELSEGVEFIPELHPKAGDIIIKDGVKYEVMEIAGELMEIRLANKNDVEDFKVSGWGEK